jgi:acyl-CoA reductase-like NAD-dependent aldehyde dehydrogenase
MVWCARESLDYVSSPAMVCDRHYGWIHWDPPTRSWHSVTNLQLSMPWRPTAEQAALRDAQAAAARAVEAARAAQDAQAAGDQQAVAARLAAVAQAAAEAQSAAERAAEAASAAQGDEPRPLTSPGTPPFIDVISQPAETGPVGIRNINSPNINGSSEVQA